MLSADADGDRLSQAEDSTSHTVRAQEWIAAARNDLTSRDQFVLVVVALAPIAWVPVFFSHAGPRVALGLLLLPLGLVVLAARALRGDLASRLAIAFAATAVVSSLVSPAVVNSIVGSVDWWLGTLGLVTVVAWWALGGELGQRARELLLPALTIGALVNALVGTLQIVFDIERGTLPTFDGRATGLMLNPVYYGAFMSGLLCCWLARLARRPVSYLVVFALAVGVGASGGRIAAAVVLLAGLSALLARGKRAVASTNLALTVAGLFSATLLVASTDNDGRAVTDRIASGGGGSVRSAIWEVALRAFLDRPLLGWGPGNIELATERQFDLSYTTANLTEDETLLRWLDVHNAGLNLLVGVGAVGVLVAAAFIVTASRGLRSRLDSDVDRALLAGAVGMAASWMLQPMTIHTAPIAALLFGAAFADMRTLIADDPVEVTTTSATGPRAAERGAVGLGLVVAVALLLNLFVVDRAVRADRLDIVDRVARYGYRDAMIDDQLAVVFLSAADGDVMDEMLERAVWYAQRLADEYPARASFDRLGQLSFAVGDMDAAEAAEQKAIAVQPWHPLSHRRLLVLSRLSDDEEQYREAMRVLCTVGSMDCVAAEIDGPVEGFGS